MSQPTRNDLRIERELYGPIDGRYFGTSVTPVSDGELEAMLDEIIELVGRSCADCGAAIADLSQHLDWHERIQHAIRHNGWDGT